MREIEFRGYDTSSKQWAYGLLYNNKEKYFINGNEIDIKSIGEFTGLYDYDKQKIYEGDILRATFNPALNGWKDTNHAFGYVIFEKGTFKLNVFADHLQTFGEEYKKYENQKETCFGIEHNFLERYYVLEIMGNLYENPDLLAATELPIPKQRKRYPEKFENNN